MKITWFNTKIFALSAVALLTSAAQAGAFPDKPVRIIVPYPAGAAADSVTRAIGNKLTQYWGQQVVVENKPGLTTGTIAGKDAAADGYTLLVGTSATMVTTPMTMKRPTYNAHRDFAPIGRMVINTPVLVAVPSLGVKTVPELLALAKSKPGKLNYASSGTGGPSQLAMEQLLSITGTDISHVGYKGAANSVTDLVGGQVQLGFNAIPSVITFIKSGKLVALATAGEKRSSLLPNVPTLAETVPGFSYTLWYGLFAPAKTPPAIVERMNREVTEVLALDDVRAKLADGGATPGKGNAATFTQFVQTESARYAAIVKAANIKE